MEPVKYETKQKVTMDEQLSELKKYVCKMNIQCFLNSNNVERRKKFIYNIIRKYYLFMCIFCLYEVFAKHIYIKLIYLIASAIVLTTIAVIIITYINRDYHQDFNSSCTNYAAYLFDRNKYEIEGTEYMAQSQYEYFVAEAIRTVLNNTGIDKDFFDNLIDKL